MQYMMGMEGNTVMVNGQVNPKLTIAPGQIQRWRVVNASTARFYRLSLAGPRDVSRRHRRRPARQAVPTDRTHHVARRTADLLIKADQKTGTYKWLSLPYNRGMMSSSSRSP